MQREGRTQLNIDELATRLASRAPRRCSSRRAWRSRLAEPADSAARRAGAADPTGSFACDPRPRSSGSTDQVLIVGVGKLMTSLGRCCRPAPDAIEGFVTRGRGVSIHRVDCNDFQHLRAAIPSAW